MPLCEVHHGEETASLRSGNPPSAHGWPGVQPLAATGHERTTAYEEVSKLLALQ